VMIMLLVCCDASGGRLDVGGDCLIVLHQRVSSWKVTALG